MRTRPLLLSPLVVLAGGLALTSGSGASGASASASSPSSPAVASSAAPAPPGQAGQAAPGGSRETREPVALSSRAASPSPEAPSGQPAASGGPAGAFSEAMDVDVVSLDVFVSDRRGQPVGGLTRDDFTVLEDGRPVAVTHFFASRADLPAALPAPAGAEAGETPPGRTVELLPEGQRLDLGVLVDEQNLVPAKHALMVRALHNFLASHLGAQDRVSVACFDGSLHIELEPTSDAAAISEALTRLAAHKAQGLGRHQDLRDIRFDQLNVGRETQTSPGLSQQVPGSTIQEEAASVRSEADLYSKRQLAHVRYAMSSLGLYIDSLAALPGRKALLFVSGGLPLHPGEQLYDQADAAMNRSHESSSANATSLLQEVIARANSSRVTLYTISAQEEAGGNLGSIERQTVETDPELNRLGDAERLDRDSSLRSLAKDTGGEVAIDPTHPEVFLAKIQKDFASYYSLGFTPNHPRDGKVHSIEVKTRDRALTVRHRGSYRAPSGIERLRDQTIAALLLGVGANPLGVEVALEAASPDAKGQVKLDVLITIPMAQLVLLPQDNFHDAKLSLAIAARDLKGWTSPLNRIELPVHIPNAQILSTGGQVAGYRTSLLVKPQETILAVGVRDDIGQVESVTRAVYRPGAAGATPTQAAASAPHP